MKNVLLVDDDSIFNLLNTKAIQQTGIPVAIHTTLNGQEAISLINEYFQFSRSLPEIILLDINVPGMDGFSFIQAFQHLPLPGIKDVKIVMITSSDNPKDVARARELGITTFLTKTINEAAIRGVLN
ncbi:MAG: response regulator [Cyclobacteriaceae bacterium]|nr:response regulator [Cyclobacteriaceae bacterium]